MALVSNTIIENYMRIHQMDGRSMLIVPQAGELFLKIENILLQESITCHARQRPWRWLEGEERLTAVAGATTPDNHFLLVTIETIHDATIVVASATTHGIYSLQFVDPALIEMWNKEVNTVSATPIYAARNQNKIFTHPPPQTSTAITCDVRGLIDTDSTTTVLAAMLAGHEVALHAHIAWRLGMGDGSEEEYNRIVAYLWEWENTDTSKWRSL